MLSHQAWHQILFGGVTQKALKIYEGGSVRDILVSMVSNAPTGEGGVPQGDASAAAPSGWAVTIGYKSAPDVFIFNTTYKTEREAQNVFDDLVKAAADVEGLIRQEKFDDAETATKDFLNKTKANTSEPQAGVDPTE